MRHFLLNGNINSDDKRASAESKIKLLISNIELILCGEWHWQLLAPLGHERKLHRSSHISVFISLVKSIKNLECIEVYSLVFTYP